MLNANRRPMSSVTFAIVSCAFRASAPPSGSPAGARSATSLTTRQSRRTKRAIALDRLLRPLHVLVGRPEEEDAEPAASAP